MKKLTSVFLVLMLVLALLPVGVMAQEGETLDTAPVEELELDAAPAAEEAEEQPEAEEVALEGEGTEDEDTELEGDADEVAQIGDTKYATLAEAVAAVEDGGTITLLKSSSGSGIATYANPASGKIAAKSFTIDFAGFTYTLSDPAVGSTGTENQGFHLERKSDGSVPNVTFRGGTINVAAGNTSMWMVIQNYCNLTLDHMTVDGTNLGLASSTYYTVSNNNGAVQIADSTLIAKSGTYAFDVCRFSNYPSVSVTVSGSSVINGKVEISGTIADGQSRQLTITGGTFNGDIEVVNEPANITVTGGTFANDPSAYVTDDDYKVEKGESTWTVSVKPTVATIGETPYTSLQKAINAATASGDTIKLLANVTENITVSGKSLTLDLGEYKITNKDANHTITVASGASLTIKGTGTVDNVSNGVGAIFNVGTVVLEGGTYERSAETGVDKNTSGGNSWYTIKNVGTMTVKAGVNIKNKGHYSSLFTNGYYNGSTKDGITGGSDAPILTIEGGTFDGGLNTIKNDDCATLNISGGTFTNYTQACVQNHNVATISDGTYNPTDAAAVINCGVCSSNAAGDAHQLTISGGTFNGGIVKTVGTIKVTGGTFSSNPSAYVTDEDRAAVKSGDVWVIKTAGNTEDGKGSAEETKIEKTASGTTVTETKTTTDETGKVTKVEEVTNQDKDGNTTGSTETTTVTTKSGDAVTKTETTVVTKDKDGKETKKVETATETKGTATTTVETVTEGATKTVTKTATTTENVVTAKTTVTGSTAEVTATIPYGTTQISESKTVAVDATAAEQDKDKVTRAEVNVRGALAYELEASVKAGTVDKLELTTDVATVSLNSTAIQTMAGDVGRNDYLKLVVEKTTAPTAVKDAKAAYKLEAFVNDQPVFTEAGASTNGTVTISVPYTQAANTTLKVFYVKDGADPVEMKATYKDGVLTWDTNHFSSFVVVEQAKTVEPTPTAAPTATPEAKTDGSTKPPRTGDESNLTLWLAVALLASCAAVTTVVVSKKKGYNK